MRLRVRIERNELPPTQALWPVKDTRNTIAQLLQQINDIFPVEVDTWGLEDYSVSVGGFDCLHYHEIGQICRDEDEVVIKPLQFVDLRSRSLTGRNQISLDGRHLVDGVPFGRPALKAPLRPEVRIPPRKKRKLLQDEQEEEQIAEGARLLLTPYGEELVNEDEDEGDSDDADFEMEASASEISSSSGTEESEGSASSSDNDSSSNDQNDTSSSSLDNVESWEGITNSEPPTPLRKDTRLTNGVPEAAQPSMQSSTGRKRKRPLNSATEPEGTPVSLEKPLQNAGLPENGTNQTKRRNRRKRDVKKLKYLVSIGTLPEGSTLESLNLVNEDKAHVGREDANEDTQKTEPHFQSDRERLLTDLESGGIDVTLQERSRGKRRKLSEIVHEATVTSKNDDDHNGLPEEVSSKQSVTSHKSNAFHQQDVIGPAVDNDIDMLLPPTTPRSRLDLTSSKRLVFGSLGFRVPKTQEERAALKKKLADRAKINVQSQKIETLNPDNEVAKTTGIADTSGQDTDDDWRSKINLTAVECCDEGVVLSTPPFPFEKWWDPQYRIKKKKTKARTNSTYMDKRKRRGQSELMETYDKYGVNGDGDALQYDDVEENGDGDEYWEEGALLNGESEDEAKGAYGKAEDEDDFPLLPPDITTLPILQKQDARIGDYITFTELACDETTNWQPKSVARTARLINRIGEDSEHVTLQMSLRDVKPKAFDGDGNRIYGKFEMPNDDDDDNDNGGREREVVWSQMGPVRLVLRLDQADALMNSD